MLSVGEIEDLDDVEHWVVAEITKDCSRKKRYIYFYNGVTEDDNDELSQGIMVERGSHISYYPDPSKRHNILITGKSGSGKSTIASDIMQKYHTENPDNEVFLISAIPFDLAFDNFKYVKRIDIPKLVTDPIDVMGELNDCMVIMDDLESLEKKELAAIIQLKKEILTKGRHNNISFMDVQHLLYDGQKTKLSLLESEVVLFHTNTREQPLYFLTKKGGLSKHQADLVMQTKSRWVMFISEYFLPIILTENRAYLPTYLPLK